MNGDEQNLETLFQDAAVENSSNTKNGPELSSELIGKLEAAKSAVLSDTPRDEVANIISGVIDGIKEELRIDGTSSPESAMPIRPDF